MLKLIATKTPALWNEMIETYASNNVCVFFGIFYVQ